jgi:hypothetical protein
MLNTSNLVQHVRASFVHFRRYNVHSEALDAGFVVLLPVTYRFSNRQSFRIRKIAMHPSVIGIRQELLRADDVFVELRYEREREYGQHTSGLQQQHPKFRLEGCAGAILNFINDTGVSITWC